jgi:NNP family nitrate/nitrite transporter-like MFS transporter
MVDRIGAKKTGQIGQIIVLSALTLAWILGIHSLPQALLLGCALGFAGASFAVALPQASRWYPVEYQGLALGIAGAGNSGTVFAGLLAPGLAEKFGWTTVFGIVLVPLLVVFILYSFMAKDAPNSTARIGVTKYLDVLRQSDAWLFMFFYFVTFGGFVGLASSLVIYFNDQYGMSPVTAGIYTSVCVFAGSMFRPIGGAIADRIGGVRALTALYQIALLCLAVVSFGPESKWLTLGLFVLAMSALGMGNGSVFQLVPVRFRGEIGVMTGLVGMAGGIGGSFLAALLGWSKQTSGAYQIGLLAFVSLAGIAALVLQLSKKRWRQTWGSPSVTTARI